MTDSCFHCAERVPERCDLTITQDGAVHPVCCLGCQAVAQLILGGGNGAYYQFREGKARRIDTRDLEHLEYWQAFDEHPVLNEHGVASATMLVEGLHCGACSWLIETRIGQHDGVDALDIDLPTGTLNVRWRPQQVRLSALLIDLTRLGFRPHPLDAAHTQRAHQREQNALLRRLAVSGLGMMQVMMFAVGTYAGAISTMDPAIERLLQGVSMLVATPVVFYAGAPFLAGAWRALRARSLNMDVPVTLALLLAFSTSCLHFFRGSGETYFESVSMFVFFLLCARWVAMVVRHRSLDAQLALAPMLPDVALRVDGDAIQPVPRRALRVGDLVLVRAGDALPGDGLIEDGQSTVNESLLSGESIPCSRAPGERVLAGSINIDAALHVRITDVDAQCAVAQMAQHLEQTRAQRPSIEGVSGRLATRFIQILLVVAAAVGLVWWQIDASRALDVVLAVLVVTCPCALSLAIPTALSAAAARLARLGVLVHRLDALETLARVNVALFDKTGTLTDGRFAIQSQHINPEHPSPLTETQLLGMAAVLERYSTHPLASAFRKIHSTNVATDVDVVAGHGIRGTVAGRVLRIGSARFTGVDADHAFASLSTVHVADDKGPLGSIDLRDGWRDDAVATLEKLRLAGLRCMVVSGDQTARVNQAVEQLGLDAGFAACLPDRKLEILREQQRAGHVALAVGDGVNDAAFLAGADVSVALADGADMARAAADVVVTGQSLHPLTDLLTVANDVPRTVRQNLGWAIGYNLIAVPLAATGVVGPGLAALGMSLSSIVVVLNSARSARTRNTKERSNGRRVGPRTLETVI